MAAASSAPEASSDPASAAAKNMLSFVGIVACRVSVRRTTGFPSSSVSSSLIQSSVNAIVGRASAFFSFRERRNARGAVVMEFSDLSYGKDRRKVRLFGTHNHLSCLLAWAKATAVGIMPTECIAQMSDVFSQLVWDR